MRSFRLDRIGSVRSLEVSFERPPGFDALAYVTHAVATLPRAHAIEVWLETTAERAREVLFPAAGVIEQVGRRVLLRSQADDLDWFARELSRLPFAFEVRKPASLNEAIAANARRLLGYLGGPATSKRRPTPR